ncbi:MAG TPA: hypothetical protein VNL16_00420 [Chloroflexota bacterium]|nr:hypothetical protein [Chloroflexota bacterium]
MKYSTFLAVATALTALAWLGSRVVRDPTTRDGIAWAVRTWFVPPDTDASWEQHKG